MTEAKTKFRCAIYTRKSTDEGLEQNFNSLDAQRAACEAYILSQAGEGWECLPQVYDDGGWSGGNMERPALKRLLDEISKGQVDIVVVYKVDRLDLQARLGFRSRSPRRAEADLCKGRRRSACARRLGRPGLRSPRAPGWGPDRRANGHHRALGVAHARRLAAFVPKSRSDCCSRLVHLGAGDRIGAVIGGVIGRRAVIP